MTYVPHPWDRYGRQDRRWWHWFSEATGWRGAVAFVTMYVAFAIATLVAAVALGLLLQFAWGILQGSSYPG